MKLVVFSHKPCWQSGTSPSGYASDGGFPFQMRALSQLFDSTTLVLPQHNQPIHAGEVPLIGDQLRIVPLTFLAGKDFARKLRFPFWVLLNLLTFIRETIKADAVHAPIPGDIGTVGILLAVVFKKPLFVRHCGNWLLPRTKAEQFWQWLMEYLAGGHNVMLATGGQPTPPSQKNSKIQWIFASSLTAHEITRYATTRETKFLAMNPRLIIVCRQEEDKGTGIVIDSIPFLQQMFPNIILDIVGDGSALPRFQEKTKVLGLENHVNFYGKVNHNRVIELLKQADLFCYPTRASEGFPKVVLEAMACGLPIVTTPVSVLPYLVGDRCGIIIKEITPYAFAEAVKSCLKDRTTYLSMSTMGYETARGYSLEVWRDQIGQHLQGAWGLKMKHG